MGETFFIVLFFMALVAGPYLLFRNWRVYKYRTGILGEVFEYEGMTERLEKYQALPEYDEMMWKFWIWPMSRFEGKGKKC